MKTARMAAGQCRRLLVGAVLAPLLAACGRPLQAEKAAPLYRFRDTRDLVSLVEDGAAHLEQKGLQALKDFSRPGSRWLHGNDYLFVYDADGTNLFHPIFPEFQGRNMGQLRDVTGQPVVDRIVAMARRPGPRASGSTTPTGRSRRWPRYRGGCSPTA
ncbi:cache domain-containing protein [Synechococcus sp. CBW1006]|uniref:cache domain-containing protein n=1 Tax=Synechococcus sp. CBW1006 TaxID=1353138 RepID=UPI001E3C43E9|nr:cache domain-containing protein [Synechococcus sp. CBW1006]